MKGRESLRGGIEEKMIMLPPHSNKDAAHEDMELDIPEHSRTYTPHYNK
jgi:hypothetical protein